LDPSSTSPVSKSKKSVEPRTSAAAPPPQLDESNTPISRISDARPPGADLCPSVHEGEGLPDRLAVQKQIGVNRCLHPRHQCRTASPALQPRPLSRRVCPL